MDQLITIIPRVISPFLDTKELCLLAQTCKYLYHKISQDPYWKRAVYTCNGTALSKCEYKAQGKFMEYYARNAWFYTHHYYTHLVNNRNVFLLLNIWEKVTSKRVISTARAYINALLCTNKDLPDGEEYTFIICCSIIVRVRKYVVPFD